MAVDAAQDSDRRCRSVFAWLFHDRLVDRRFRPAETMCASTQPSRDRSGRPKQFLCRSYRHRAATGGRHGTRCLLWGILILMLTAGRVQSDIMVDSLRLAMRKQQENRAKIITWKGEVRIEDRRSDAKGNEVISAHDVEFVYARDKGRYRWDWRVEEQIGRQPDPPIENSERSAKQICAMRKYLSLYRLEGAAGHGRRTIAIRDLDEWVITPESKSFDPAHYLSGHVNDLDTVLDSCDRHTKPLKREKVLIAQVDSRIELELTDKEGTKRYEIDLARGGNVIRFELANQGGRTLSRYVYKEVSGVWVPKKTVSERFSPQNERQFVRTIEFLENVMNQPLSKDEFSLAALGAVPGDLVQDTRANVQYVYRGPGKTARTPGSVSSLEKEETAAISLSLNIAAWALLIALLFAVRRWAAAREFRNIGNGAP